MERQANYALVGALALALFAGLMVFIVWLAGAQFNREFDNYRIVFRESVQGLSNGGEVYYNGIRVGEVTDLDLDARDPNRVVAQVRLDGDTPVKTDSVAQLEPLGITGVNIIQISAGRPNAPLLKDTVRAGVIPTIQSRPSPLAGLLSGGGTLLEQAVTALENANRILSPENARQLSLTLANVQNITADVAQREALLDDVQATVRSADQAAAEIALLARDARGVINGDGADTVREIDATAAELRAAAQDARAVVADLRAPAQDFATTGLPQLTQSLISLQQAAESLDRVVSDIGSNPRSLLTSGEGREREVAP